MQNSAWRIAGHDRSGDSVAGLWMERLLIGAVLAAYLYLFQTEAPNGDGRVYMRLIEGGAVVWNPNHLLMQPIGLAFHAMTRELGLSLFAALRLLAGISAVVAMLLFHVTLTLVPVRSRLVRVLATLALCFSSSFLSMAIAEEYFMVQMVPVGASLVLGVGWTVGRWPGHERLVLLSLGLVTALAAAIQVNNVLLCFFVGLAVAWQTRAHRSRALINVATVWGGSAALALPLFVGAYLSSATDANALAWLTAYQGQTGNTLENLYGITWTPTGVAIAASTLVYGFATNIVLLGQLGPVAESLLRARPLEFEPNLMLVITMGAVFVALCALVCLLAIWVARTGRRHAVVPFALFFMAGHLVFNFLWVDVGDQFWMQVLLPLWLLVAIFLGSAGARESSTLHWSPLILAIIVPFLAIANTLSTVVPRAHARVDEKRQALMQLVHPGDLVITTGWDQITWIAPTDRADFERVQLMDLAIRSRAGDSTLQRLPERLETELKSGRRVIVARLFDLDGEARPWEQLTKLGWPRQRLQQLFSGFDTRPIGEIDQVAFRELLPPDSH